MGIKYIVFKGIFEVFDVFEILQIYLNTNTNTHNM